jgi:putative phosphoribosyl transferase
MFKNRTEAAKQLAKALSKYKNQKPVIMAIPRGGVVIGSLVAHELNAPLEISLSKKIGHPSNKEFAIGAVSLHGALYNQELNIPPSYIRNEVENIRHQLKEKYIRFKGDTEPVSLQGKTAIIIDDGIATGSTILATIELVRSDNPRKIVIAVPVAPPNIKKHLEDFVDEIVVLHSPQDFDSVGTYYENFEQLSDEDVISILEN